MAENPPICMDTGSVAMFQTASLPIMYMRKVFAMANETAKNRIIFRILRVSVLLFQGCVRKAICAFRSPSNQYSILRKTISIKMVCGQTHPQNTLPKITVKRIMKTTNMSIPKTKMKKSCGQKRTPKRM